MAKTKESQYKRHTKERRRSRRINFKLDAEIISNTKNYKGVIENLSKSGICKIVFSEKSVLGFLPGEKIEVRYYNPSGKYFNVICQIKWTRINTHSPLVLKYILGVQVIKPSQQYRKFVESLL
jgi:hypothetical protein